MGLAMRALIFLLTTCVLILAGTNLLAYLLLSRLLDDEYLGVAILLLVVWMLGLRLLRLRIAQIPERLVQASGPRFVIALVGAGLMAFPGPITAGLGLILQLPPVQLITAGLGRVILARILQRWMGRMAGGSAAGAGLGGMAFRFGAAGGFPFAGAPGRPGAPPTPPWRCSAPDAATLMRLLGSTRFAPDDATIFPPRPGAGPRSAPPTTYDVRPER
jgi:hypothetical protein